MATVKEKAAALNLEGKLCLRSPGHVMVNKPFQAFPIWSSVIANLRVSVKVKRRRFHLKFHNDCFLGSDAVDVVLEHIVQSKFFNCADVSREKVGRVCQALLECQVFEMVGDQLFGKDKQDVFHDSKSYLYRFLNTEMPSVAELEKGVIYPGIQSIFGSTSGRQEELAYLHGTPVRSNKLLSTVTEDLSISPCKAHIDTSLPQNSVEEVWQEETVLRLLQLVELPLLDDLLGVRDSSLPRMAQMEPDVIYTSNYLDREILSAFKNSLEDDWLTAALDCLEFLPDQQVVEVSRELPRCPDVVGSGHSNEQCKRMLYETLVKYYNQPDHVPLLTNRTSDIYTGITELLVNADFDKALEALQLYLKLLHPVRREELRTLLCFMSVAADPLEIKLDKLIDNKIVVKRAFHKAILHSRGLTKEKVYLLVLFMLDNHHDIFKIPGSLHKLVSEKLANTVQGKHPDVTGPKFCHQVSTQVYSDCTQRATHEELLSLLRNIDDDPKLSVKKKKRLLKQFYQGHPKIFVEYFGDSVPAAIV
ncbi:hypothetical protein UPYG_G00268600 [Umbra pygmaea]|uniref:DEP domain-containing protein 7 n=1 Tax=Umbra pygmaea TaxID=75934 RepID=A0ABD0WF98_UMBPY